MATRDYQRCLGHILSATVDPYRNGGRRTIAQCVRDAIERGEAQPQTANTVLETYGLAVVIEQRGTPAALRWLLVANTHPGLAQIFAGSHWAAQSGGPAPWIEALRRIRGACPVAFRRFAGYGCRATKLPLDHMLAEPSGTSPKPMRRSTTARRRSVRRSTAGAAIPFNERPTLTIKEASAFTGLSKTTLYDLWPNRERNHRPASPRQGEVTARARRCKYDRGQ
jgi:predicted DNA-binding transcriptional regulator AlpA